MTLEEIIQILSKLNNRFYIVHRDLKEASSVAKVYRDYIISLWLIDTKDAKNNSCVLTAHEVGQWTDRNKDELVRNVEQKFMEQLLNGIKNNTL